MIMFLPYKIDAFIGIDNKILLHNAFYDAIEIIIVLYSGSALIRHE